MLGAILARVLDLLGRLFDNNAKDVARMNRDIVQRVNALESETEKIDNLAAAFSALRARVKAGETLDGVMPEAFALVREASIRTLGLRHFDVQVVGGAALHYGRISEMKTGEGKTLVATLALALNALEGKGAHLVTVNDYLAKVGAEQMGIIYRTLGLSIGLIQHDLDPTARKRAYAEDITYVTNSELGFDYLRDNMSVGPDQLVLRADHPLNYAIIDEVDSILIDEARTPLIISGPSEKGTSNYYLIAKLAPLMQRGEPAIPGDLEHQEPTLDYTIDEKSRGVHLTEQGIVKAEKLLSITGLFDSKNMELAHMITQAIRAKELYSRDKDYIVDENNEVVIVDEFTGRLMPGRRYGEGLHQAIEAKEGVQIQNESQTFATITYQNFFRQFTKICGMTGTAKTEEKEFIELYGADVLVIPTNLPMIRRDYEDLVYRSENGKFKAAIEELVERHSTGQPVLVGTISIEKSELLSNWLSDPKHYSEFLDRTAAKLLEQLGKSNASGLEAFMVALGKPATLTPDLVASVKGQMPKAVQDTFSYLEREVNTITAIRKGVKHQVLNAKYHDREADIIAQAGRSQSVTISTNMAGRGTDIKLGGNAEFAAYHMLEGRNLSRYDEGVELMIAAILRDDLNTAQGYQAKLEVVSEDDFDAIINMRDEFAKDFELVKELGGLHIIGTERHESRRIDNQLRGRSGRQGDPGSSRFYVSFEDELMRLFANERVVNMLDRLGMDDTIPIEAKMVTSAIERAQKRVEERNFATRKQLLEFDNVMSKQREVIYAQRREVLLGPDEDISETVEGMIHDFVEGQVNMHLQGDGETWNIPQLRATLIDAVPQLERLDMDDLRRHKIDEARADLLDKAADAYEERTAELSEPVLRSLERFVILQIVDQSWKEHLHAMDVLRQGIFLRGYGQKDPFVEYKFEGTNLFADMIEGIKAEVTKFVFRMQVTFEQPPQEVQPVEASLIASGGPQAVRSASPFGPTASPFSAKAQQTRIPKMSRQERRRIERDDKKGK